MNQKLSPIERDILSKLNITQLQFLSKVAHDKEFEVFIRITEVLSDYEKNYVFKLDESRPNLAVEKAYSRGKAGGYTQVGRIILAASEEIERREKNLEERSVKKDA